ncbi:MAG: amidohydrolase family protein [Adhaeribacter sp.]
MKHKLLTILMLGALQVAAQVPAPAPPQKRPVVLTGATLHVGNGTVIGQATVLFDQGKILYAGPAAGAPATGQAEQIDVSGQHIYPGLIQPNTQLGLNEVEAVRATLDEREVGLLNPNVRALVAYNTDSDVLPTIRANGVLQVQVTPLGGTLSGQSSVMQLDAWNWEDAVVKADEGLHLHWPALPGPGPAPTPEQSREREKLLQDLRAFFQDAAAYGKGRFPKQNFKLTAMQGLFDGSKKLYLHANNAREIMEGVRFVQQAGVKSIVLVGGRDAWRITDFLRDNQIPVILSGVHALPGLAGDDTDLPYKTPFLLQQAGILFALDYSASLHGVRNLPFIAGTAVAYGLSKEQALMAVSGNTAKILGIADRTGTVEAGKDATLVVSTGDLLDMRSNNVTLAFIQGRSIQLTDKQKYLYLKFKKKYEAGK